MYFVGITHARVFKFFSNSHHDWLSNAGIDYVFIDEERQHAENIKTLITAEIGSAELKRYPNLEAVIVPFAAINQLDIEALLARNIRIFNTSAHAPFVAERALALILAVLGKVVYFHKLLENGDWAGRVEGRGFGKTWTSLFEKKVAIYGFGSIGQSLANLLKPFDVEIGILRRKGHNFLDFQTFDSLEDLARWSDVFVISAPLNDATKASVNQSVMAALKDSVLINVGRGEIVDEKALFESLSQNILAGFGCDVWYNYPTAETPICPPSHFPIETFENVVMTPHNGGSTETADEVKYLDVAEQLKMIARGDYSRQVL